MENSDKDKVFFVRPRNVVLDDFDIIYGYKKLDYDYVLSALMKNDCFFLFLFQDMEDKLISFAKAMPILKEYCHPPSLEPIFAYLDKNISYITFVYLDRDEIAEEKTLSVMSIENAVNMCISGQLKHYLNQLYAAHTMKEKSSIPEFL